MTKAWAAADRRDGWVRSFLGAALGLGSLLATAGCSSAPEVYGTRARFSPAFQGYVMAPEGGSDDPAEHDAVLLLRDPLTGNKLRCRADVVEWRELHEDLATDRVHDDNVDLAVAVTTGVVFGPLLAAEPVGGLILAEAFVTAEQLSEMFRSDDARELLAAGVVLHRRGRFAQASQVLERALAKDPAVGTHDKAYLYLGLSYVEQDKRDRARLALLMFVERAAVRDVTAYRTAAAALKKLGVSGTKCASTEPVELRW